EKEREERLSLVSLTLVFCRTPPRSTLCSKLIKDKRRPVFLVRRPFYQISVQSLSIDFLLLQSVLLLRCLIAQKEVDSFSCRLPDVAIGIKGRSGRELKCVLSSPRPCKKQGERAEQLW